MRQLTAKGPNQVEWVEVPDPELTSPKAAMLRPVAVGVCDFDRGLVSGRYSTLPFPIALGHEIVAQVVEIGAEVKTLRQGQHVILPLHISCGECAPCTGGHTNSCDARKPLSNYGLGAAGGNWGGGMSDLLVVPYADAMAVPMPEGFTPADCAALGCNLVDLHRTMQPHLQAFPDPHVLIVSGHAGNMALYGVAMARALGIRKIDFLDDDERRLQAAASLGATTVRMGQPLRKEGYPIVVDCGADPERLAIALASVAKDGVCTPVWPYPGTAAVPIGQMFRKNVTLITGQPHARAHMDPVLRLMAEHGFGSKSIPVEVLPWDSADQLFGRGEVKRIFVRDSLP